MAVILSEERRDESKDLYVTTQSHVTFSTFGCPIPASFALGDF